MTFNMHYITINVFTSSRSRAIALTRRQLGLHVFPRRGLDGAAHEGRAASVPGNLGEQSLVVFGEVKGLDHASCEVHHGFGGAASFQGLVATAQPGLAEEGKVSG